MDACNTPRWIDRVSPSWKRENAGEETRGRDAVAQTSTGREVLRKLLLREGKLEHKAGLNVKNTKPKHYHFPIQGWQLSKCLVSCDHIPRRSCSLSVQRLHSRGLIAGFSNPGIHPQQEQQAT